MRRLSLLFAVVFVLPLLGSDSPRELDDTTIKTDELQGTWQVVDSLGQVFTFRKGRYSLTLGKNTITGSYKIDHKENPPHLDEMSSSQEAAGRTWMYIYQLDGDQLKLAYVSTAGWDGRPKSFSDSNTRILTLKRLKQ